LGDRVGGLEILRIVRLFRQSLLLHAVDVGEIDTAGNEGQYQQVGYDSHGSVSFFDGVQGVELLFTLTFRTSSGRAKVSIWDASSCVNRCTQSLYVISS